MRGSGPARLQITNASAATPMTMGHEVAGHEVGELLDGSAAALRLGHHGHDTREQGLGADLLGAHDQRAGAVDRRSDDRVAGLLLHRDGLARDHGFVDVARALEHHAIHGHLLAGPHAQPIAGLHRIERDIFLAAIRAQAAGRLGGQTEQLADGGAGLAARAQLEHLAEQDQRDDHGRCFEIHGDRAGCGTERSRKDLGQQRGPQCCSRRPRSRPAR
jgi:hypothetical protein